MGYIILAAISLTASLIGNGLYDKYKTHREEKRKEEERRGDSWF